MTDFIFPALSSIRLLDVIDVLLVAVLLYELYNLVKGTAAINILIGIVAVFIMWRLVKALEMELLSEILGAFISVGFIALIVVFQPEIRKFLLFVGSPVLRRKKRTRFLFWRVSLTEDDQLDVDPLVQACHKLALSKTGALIVITLRNELIEFIETGLMIDARISDQLIENIFYKNNPLHDGAVIITTNRITAARCILPVSKNTELPISFGLRHRSAVGLTERTDAICIIVSEQTGHISFSKQGELKSNILPAELKNLLEKEFSKVG
ncbi:MAG: diadenylate cyclase CdaA [Bacteroidota bacterium]